MSGSNPSESVIPPPCMDSMLEVARLAPPGAFAELGVYRGGSAMRLAEICRARGGWPLFLFDTFTGIPFKGEFDDHRVGDFCDTSVDLVRSRVPDATIIAGVFPESLVGLDVPPLAFVHVDADQYASVRAALEHFPALMVRGGLLLVDDYQCLNGATMAVNEWAESNRHTITTTRHGKAVWRKP